MVLILKSTLFLSIFPATISQRFLYFSYCKVANRRKLVETFLQCLNRLEATESVLNASLAGHKQNQSKGGEAVSESGQSTARSSQRARLLR